MVHALPRHLERRGSARDGAAFGTLTDSAASSGRATASDPASTVPYAELHAHSNYSFLDGASSPTELYHEAARLGLHALALTDHDGLYGIVRMAEAAELHRSSIESHPERLARHYDAVNKGKLLAKPEAPLPPVDTVFGAELSLGLSAPQNGIADPEGQHLLVLARKEEGYRRLAGAITAAQLAGEEKGKPLYDEDELAQRSDGHWLILTGCRKGAVRSALGAAAGLPPTIQSAAEAGHQLDRLVERFGPNNVVVELFDHGNPLDSSYNDALAVLAQQRGLPTVATGNVHYAGGDRYRLASALASVRARRSLDDMDGWLPAAGTAQLRSGAQMAARFRRYPGAVERTVGFADELSFALRKVSPKLPKQEVPAGHDPMSWLEHLVWEAAAVKYPHIDNPRTEKERRKGDQDRERIAMELRVIKQKDFPGYFLIVHDIVQFAKARGILCQGRGSAANSAVCFLLGVTAVDPIFYELPFERFLSSMRDEEPDIDVDFDSRRREEAIQYVYAKYGRLGAAQVANVITYRSKFAVRDMAKALGATPGQQDAWSKLIERGSRLVPSTPSTAGAPGTLQEPLSTRGGKAKHPGAPIPEVQSPAQTQPPAADAPRGKIRGEARTANDDPIPEDAVGSRARAGWRTLDQRGELESEGIPGPVLSLAHELLGFPRHLGIHSGGMVLTDEPVGEVCPIEPARMQDRTVLQWDKDDCAWMGLVKFDLLGLGMLSALQYTLDLARDWTGDEWTLESIPKEEPAVYDTLCRADSIGVFQVESRAQMGSLPRVRPRNFYDLAIQIALIRPGPIQGDSVHPYMERRRLVIAGRAQDIHYAHPKLEPILQRTLGIPIFQEQAIKMAMAVADFTPSETGLLRRAMGSKSGLAKLAMLEKKLYEGLEANGITGEDATRIHTQIKGFADFGFAESHSLSFALLVYASTWMRLHYPAAFLAGLLRSQPMGFYSPASLVADARRHGVTVLKPDIQRSDSQTGLEPVDGGTARCAPTGSEGCLGLQDPIPEFDPAAPDESAAHRRDGALAVRLGLAQVHGIGTALADRIEEERTANGPYADMHDLVRRTGLTVAQLEALAGADAFACFGLTRRQALWEAGNAAQDRAEFLSGTLVTVQPPLFSMPSQQEELFSDLWATGISPTDHAMNHLRSSLDRRGVLTAAALRTAESGRRVEVAGIVTHRQRPGTASGITFVNLEDETGLVNVICSVGVWKRYRRVARGSAALLIRGMLERSSEGVCNIVADRIEDLGTQPTRQRSRDFQ